MRIRTFRSRHCSRRDERHALALRQRPDVRDEGRGLFDGLYGGIPAERNGADRTPEVVKLPDTDRKDGSSAERPAYRNGTRDTEVVLYKIVNGGHSTSSLRASNGRAIPRLLGPQSADIEMTEEIWSSFKDKTSKHAL